MIQFKVSAPGKVILFGEHAVVYGKTAVAGSLDLRTSLDFAELPEVEQTLNICFPHVNLIMIVPLQQIHNFFLANRDTQFLENYEMFYSKVKEFVSMFNCGNLQQKLSLEAFFYLLFYITLKEGINVRPFRIQLTTELALGAGLGSSGSFAVCLAACFLHWSHLQKNISKMFDLSNLENISKYALNCERTMHGSPSGIDNAVCTYGSIIEFKKGEYMKPMNNIHPMKILLVDTRVSRSTKTILEKLLELKSRYPVIIDIIMDAIDNISNEAIRNIQKLKNTSRVNDGSFSEEYKQLMTLINMNQGLLATCQVSHPSLDSICAEAQSYGLAGKLTGAGGGGHAFILLLPETQPETISSLSRKLIADGFTVKLTFLGGPGVQVHP